MIETMQEIINHDFGIEVGKTMKIKVPKTLQGDVPPYDGGVYTVNIKEEYPYFFTGTVFLYGYKGRRKTKSSIKITLSKVDMYTGNLKVMG